MWAFLLLINVPIFCRPEAPSSAKDDPPRAPLVLKEERISPARSRLTLTLLFLTITIVENILHIPLRFLYLFYFLNILILIRFHRKELLYIHLFPHNDRGILDL